VYTTVDFNDHSSGMTVKVSDKTVNHLLLSKMETFQPVISQMIPKYLFLRRHFTPELFGSLLLDRINLLTNDDPIGFHGCSPDGLTLVRRSNGDLSPGPSPALSILSARSAGRGESPQTGVYLL
jgi:hypothetical protein